MSPEVVKQRRAYERECERLGIEPRRGGAWFAHARTIGKIAGKPPVTAPPLTPRSRTRAELRAAELRAWWLERFTIEEIRAMGGALEGLA